jgi:hypothetical protein
VASAHNSPPRIIPHRGKVSSDSGSPENSKSWRVFHEYEAWSHFANDAGHLFPESAFCAIKSFACPCHADVLARESASDDVHQSTPWLSIEGSHIVPDREGIEASVILSGHEDTAGVVVIFDGADGFPAEQFATKYSSSSACEKCQLM